jgi:cytosine/adenosine deaminase-related metal-dependent hydrolase
VPDMLEQGLCVGLGSDGYIDDFFTVMKGAFLIHKAARQSHRDAGAAGVAHGDGIWRAQSRI